MRVPIFTRPIRFFGMLTISLLLGQTAWPESHTAVSGADVFTPDRVSDLPGTEIGTIRLDRLSSSAVPIKVYGSSPGNTGGEVVLVSPYIAISPLEFGNLYSEQCSSDPTATLPQISFHVETGAGDVFDAVNSQIEDHASSEVDLYPYRSLELVDARTLDVIWRNPLTVGIVPYQETPLPWTRVFSLGPISCVALERYASGGNELIARAIVPSSIESASVTRFTYSAFRDRVFSLDFLQESEADGTLDSFSNTIVTGSSNSSGLVGSILGGGSSASTETTVSNRLTDSRRRWIDRNAARSLATTFAVDIRASRYCVEGADSCSHTEITDQISAALEEFLSYETIPIITQPGDVAQNGDGLVFAVTDPGSIQRSLNSSMSPSFSDSSSLNVDCEAIGQAIVGGAAPANAGTAFATPGANSLQGGWPEATSTPRSPQASQTSPGKPASRTSPGECGFDQDIQIKDTNNVVWSHNGSDWVPTSIELALVDEARLVSVLGQQIVTVIGSREAQFVDVSVPLASVDDATPSEFGNLRQELRGLLGRLENPSCRQVLGGWVANRESCNDHANFMTQVSCNPGEYMASFDIIHAQESPIQRGWQCRFKVSCCSF